MFGSSRYHLIARTYAVGLSDKEYLWADGVWRTTKPATEFIRCLPLDSSNAAPFTAYVQMDAKGHTWCVNIDYSAYDGATPGVVGWFDLNYYSSVMRGVTLNAIVHCIPRLPATYNAYTYFIDV
jgi:hypothetical protein